MEAWKHLTQYSEFTASERRVLLSKWIGEAWEKVCTKPEIITRGFRKCGISIAVDGSEDEVININGVDDYTVGSIKSSDDDDDDVINSEPGEESDAEGSAVASSSEYTGNDTEDESSIEVQSISEEE